MPEMGRSQSPTPSEATSHHSAFGPYNNNNNNNNAVGLGMGGMGGMGGSMISDKYPDNVSAVVFFESTTSRTNFDSNLKISVYFSGVYACFRSNPKCV